MEELLDLKKNIIENCQKKMDSLTQIDINNIYLNDKTIFEKKEEINLMNNHYVEYESNFENLQNLLEIIMDLDLNHEDNSFQEMIEEFVSVISQNTEIIKMYLENIEKNIEKILNQDIKTYEYSIKTNDNKKDIIDNNLLLNQMRKNKINHLYKNFYKSLINAYKSYIKFLNTKLEGIIDGSIGMLNNAPNNLYM